MEELRSSKIRDGLPTNIGTDVHVNWLEFEKGTSPEAKFARALDNLEVQLQHNFASLNTWKPIEYDLVYTKMDKHCGHDDFLLALCNAIKNDAELKLVEGGVDVDQIKERLANNQI